MGRFWQFRSGPTTRALRARTSEAAFQAFEEDEKGSLEPGELADLAALPSNPLAVASIALRDLEGVRTIKAGEAVWPSQD